MVYFHKFVWNGLPNNYWQKRNFMKRKFKCRVSIRSEAYFGTISDSMTKIQNRKVFPIA